MTTVTAPPQPETTAATPRRRRGLDRRHIPVLATLPLLVLMYSIGVANYDNFARPHVFLNVFVDNAFLVVVAVGMSCVILTGGIVLSVGAVVALTTVVAA